MCGRYAASASQDKLVEVFEIDEVAGPLPAASFNVAPTDQVPAVLERMPKDDSRAEPVRKLVPLKWGLVPSWSKSPNSGAKMINARVETVSTKPAFRKALASRRCLLPADGYYEWYPRAEPGPTGRPRKQPFFIRPSNGGLLVMAGLYEFWRSPAGEWLTTCTVITTKATDSLGHIHDRMPMVVHPDAVDAWLDPRVTADAVDLLTVDEADLTAYAVPTLVNKVANNGPELIEPLADAG